MTKRKKSSFNDAKRDEEKKPGEGGEEAPRKREAPSLESMGFSDYASYAASVDKKIAARRSERRSAVIDRLGRRGVDTSALTRNSADAKKFRRIQDKGQLENILKEKFSEKRPGEDATAADKQGYRTRRKEFQDRQSAARDELARRERGEQRAADVKTYGNVAYGPSMTVEIGGKKVTHYGSPASFAQVAANARAINGINANNVSFSGSGANGMTGSLRDMAVAKVGEARKAAITDMLAKMGDNAEFMAGFKGDAFGKLRDHEKLAAYSKFLTDKLGARPEVLTYEQRKQKWLNERKGQEADRRIELFNKANGGKGSAGPSGLQPGGSGGRSGVYLDDLMYQKRDGFSGVNGTPYMAGDPNRRGVQEFARAQARSASERAMYNQMRSEARKKDLKDSADFAQYVSANYSAYQGEQQLARDQQKLWDMNRKIAQRVTQAAMFSAGEFAKANPGQPQGTAAATGNEEQT